MKKNSNNCLYKNVCDMCSSNICGKCQLKHHTIIDEDIYNKLKNEHFKENEEIDEGLKNAIIQSKRR